MRTSITVAWRSSEDAHKADAIAYKIFGCDVYSLPSERGNMSRYECDENNKAKRVRSIVMKLGGRIILEVRK